MVIMVSSIAHGCVRTTMMVESHKMAAILQITGWRRHAALVYHVFFLIYDIVLWSTDTCQVKLSTNQYHVTISRAQVHSSLRSRVLLKLTADQVLVFDWIAGSCEVNLLKTELDSSMVIRMPVKSNPGLKVNQIITVSSIQMFFVYSFCFVYRFCDY